MTARGQRSTFPSASAVLSEAPSRETEARPRRWRCCRCLIAKTSLANQLPVLHLCPPPPQPPFPGASFYLAKELSAPPGPITHVSGALTGPAFTVSEGRIWRSLPSRLNQRARRHQRHQREHGGTSRPHSFSFTDRPTDASPLMRNAAADSVDQTLHQSLQPSALLSPQLVRESLASGAVINEQTSSSTPTSSRRAVLPPTPYPLRSHRALGRPLFQV